MNQHLANLMQMHPFWMSGPLINFRVFWIAPIKTQNWSSYFNRITLLYSCTYLVVIRMVMHIGPTHPSTLIMLRLLIVSLKMFIISLKNFSRTIKQRLFLLLIMEWVIKVGSLYSPCISGTWICFVSLLPYRFLSCAIYSKLEYCWIQEWSSQVLYSIWWCCNIDKQYLPCWHDIIL